MMVCKGDARQHRVVLAPPQRPHRPARPRSKKMEDKRELASHPTGPWGASLLQRTCSTSSKKAARAGAMGVVSTPGSMKSSV